MLFCLWLFSNVSVPLHLTSSKIPRISQTGRTENKSNHVFLAEALRHEGSSYMQQLGRSKGAPRPIKPCKLSGMALSVILHSCHAMWVRVFWLCDASSSLCRTPSNPSNWCNLLGNTWHPGW